jgi:hypothetical protein
MNDEHHSLFLLETWIQLARNDSFPDAQHFSLGRIKAIFGSIAEAEQYVKKEKKKSLNKVGT